MTFGEIELGKLHALHVQEAYDLWLQNGRQDGNGGLSAQTVVHHHRVLGKAISQAIKWGLISYNPMLGVEPPRPPKHEIHTLDEAQSKYILELSTGRSIFVPVLLGITCGLRRGEICGLKWVDIDFERHFLSIRRSLEETKNGLRLKEPKTKRGARQIALAKYTVEALRAHRVEQSKERLRLGSAYENNDLVYANPRGEFARPRSLTKQFGRLHELYRLGRHHIAYTSTYSYHASSASWHSPKDRE